MVRKRAIAWSEDRGAPAKRRAWAYGYSEIVEVGRSLPDVIPHSAYCATRNCHRVDGIDSTERVVKKAARAEEVSADLGDPALLRPASTFLLGYLIYAHSTCGPILWSSTLVLCIGLTAMLKIGLYICGGEALYLHMRSPSGHTSFAMTFYGCCALILAGDKDPRYIDARHLVAGPCRRLRLNT
jgi:hypothetical protein